MVVVDGQCNLAVTRCGRHFAARSAGSALFGDHLVKTGLGEAVEPLEHRATLEPGHTLGVSRCPRSGPLMVTAFALRRLVWVKLRGIVLTAGAAPRPGRRTHRSAFGRSVSPPTPVVLVAHLKADSGTFAPGHTAGPSGPGPSVRHVWYLT